MIETFDYIERYFTKNLSPEDVIAFEDRCLNDKAFAEDVALYISSRDILKQDLHTQKKKEFAELHEELNSKTTRPALILRMRPFILAAAACLLLFFGWMLFFSKPSANTLATNYIEKNFSTIGITMGNDSKDSVQAGIAAYNNKNFSEAEKIFQSLHYGAQRAEAEKYSGIIFLSTGRYDKAIAEFDALAREQELYSNPGMFYKALALLKRSGPGDEKMARNLLEELIRKDLPGSKEAKELLHSM